MWVLVVISVVWGGQTVTFQEFKSEQRCLVAKSIVIEKSVKNKKSLEYVECVEK